MKKQKGLVVGVSVLLVVLAGSAATYYITRSNSADQQEDPIAYVQESEDTEIGTLKLVDKYSGEYSETLDEVRGVAIQDWDDTTVEKAYFCLLYADKIGDFTQVNSMLFLIESAKQQGVDVDYDSRGVGSKELGEIQKRASARAEDIQ